MTALETAIHSKLVSTPHAYIKGRGLAVESTAMPNLGNWKPDDDVQEHARFLEQVAVATK